MRPSYLSQQGDVYVDLTDMSECLLCHAALDDTEITSFCPRCAFCVYQTRFVDGGAFQTVFTATVIELNTIFGSAASREDFLSAFHAMLPSCLCGSVGGHDTTCPICNRRSQEVMFGFCYESEPIRRS